MSALLPNTSASQISGFNEFDWLLLFLLSWSLVQAFVRGIIRELFGLAGTILGLLLASWNYPALSTWLSGWITFPVASEVAAFLAISVGVMFAFTLLGRLLRGTAHTLGLGLLDRIAGAGFGLLRGGVLSMGILMAAAAFCPPQNLVANSRLAPYFLAAAREVCFVVPPDLQRRVTGGIASIRHIARR